MEPHCICAEIPKVEARTGVLVLRHALEERKSTNTARIARLALPDVKIVDYDAGRPPDVDALVEAHAPAWLLYPGREGQVPEGRPSHIVVLDGTWVQARKMLHKHPSLLRLPRLSLATPPAEMRRLRSTPIAGARSTLEAIADALRVVEGDAIADPLHALHALYVERVLTARGMWRAGA